MANHRLEKFEDINPIKEQPTKDDYDFIEDYENLEDNIDNELDRQN